MTAGEKLPILTLKNLVVFPNVIAPLYVGRELSIAAVENSITNYQKKILLVAQKDVNLETPAIADLAEVGVVAEIVQTLRLPNGTIKLLVEGKFRAGLVDGYIDDQGGLFAKAKEIPEEFKLDKQLDALMNDVSQKFEDFVKQNKKIPAETLLSIINIEDPAKFADLVAANLTLSAEEKQKLVENPKVIERLYQIHTYCKREVGLVEVEKNLDSNIQTQIEKIQREYYLKEKLKAIHRELGEVETDELSEIDEYKERVSSSAMPDKFRQKALKELGRLEKLQAYSAESGVIRSYVNLLLDLPWGGDQISPLNMQHARAVLDECHYGLDSVKQRVLEFLAVYQSTGKVPSSVLLLVGPPGVGKTSIAKAIADAMGREYARIPLGGMRDEALLRGHRRTYVGAMPGKLVEVLIAKNTNNPVVVLDEIDKISRGVGGDPSAVLLEVLDRSQNSSFLDNYLELPIDLSQVVFVATANTVHEISKPLLDRMEVLKIAGYTEDEKLEIAKNYLVPKQLKEHGLSVEQLQFTDEVIREIIVGYTKEAGVRNLERLFAKICRKHLKSSLEGDRIFPKVSKHNLVHYLGDPDFMFTDRDLLSSKVGVVNGLAWTESGGDVLPVEVTVMPGKGELLLTGQMGDVMKESAQAALSYVRSKSTELGLDPEVYLKRDIHVHLPDGAIPKDGPSAGVAIATAMASALSGLPVSAGLGMSGEISLRGRVLPVGGLKEKVLAAMRNNLKMIIVPEDNRLRVDSLKIPKRKLKIVYVRDMSDVLYLALQGFTDARQVNPLTVLGSTNSKDADSFLDNSADNAIL